MPERLVVVGGDAAGMSAASQARRRRGPDELEVVAFERGRYTSFAACGIPYWIAGLVDDRDDLIARHPETFREKQHIDVHLRTEVVGIDTREGRVEVWDHEAGRSRTEPYDQLLIATGARPTRPQMPGLDSDGVFGVQTLDDGAAVNAYLEQRPVETAVVVGGGYIGLEMAEAMVHRGIDVTVVEAAPQVMPTLDADMAAGLVTALEDIGITVRLDTPVQGFAADDEGHVRAVTTDEGELPADLVFLGLGTRPESASPRTPGSRSARPAGSSWTADSTRRSTASGPPVTAPRPSTGWPGSPSPSRSARSRTSRAASPASTSAAARRASRACSAPPSPGCATSRSPVPA